MNFHKLLSKKRYPENRKSFFSEIKIKAKDYKNYHKENSILINTDSKEFLKEIPDGSINLILTDPPYHTTKKENIEGDRDFSTDEDYLNWLEIYFNEFKRILAPNGSGYVFCSSEMAPLIYTKFSNEFNMLNLITWAKPNEPGYDGWKQKMSKESLRNWYPHSESIIYFEKKFQGNLKEVFFGHLIKELRIESSLTSKQLTGKVGAYGKVNNGGAVSNWEAGRNIPSRAQWEKICQAIKEAKPRIKTPAYEDIIRNFEMTGEKEFIDVWNFQNVRQYKGKHPAEKPIDMLNHIIESSSYEHDIVLDCFSGSGSTIHSAHRLKRHSIGIEIEKKWFQYSSKKLKLLDKVSDRDLNRISSNIKTKNKVYDLFTSND